MIFPALSLKGNFNILNLLPQGSQKVANLNHLIDTFGGDDRLLIAVEGEPETCAEFIDLLRGIITEEDGKNEEPFFKGLEGVTDEQRGELIRSLFENGVFLCSAEQIREIADRFTSDRIAEEVRRDRILMRRGSPVSKQRVKYDPLNLSEVFTKSIPEQVRNMGSGSFRSSKDGRLCMLELQPTQLPQNGEFSTNLLAFSKKCVDKALKQFEGDKPAVSFTGGYALAASDTERIISVVVKTFIISLVIVAAMLFFAFKEVKILFLIIPSLGVAILWTAGSAQILFGEITIVSAAFAAILIGLGVDFAIHIYNRFRVELETGKSPEDAMTAVHADTGGSVLMGAVTTAAAFYILAISDFKGVREFGILVGSGVLLSAFVYLTSFSSILVIMARRGFSRTFTREFGLGKLFDIIRRKPGMLLSGFSLLFVVSCVYLFTGKGLEFESDARNLRPVHDPVLMESKRFSDTMGLSLVHFPVMVNADSFGELLDRTAEVAAGLASAKKKGLISDYLSPGDFIRSTAVQKENLEVLGKVDFTRAVSDLKQELKKNRIREEPFKETFEFLKRLQDRVEKRRIMDESVMDSEILSKTLSRFFIADPEKKRYTSLSVFYTHPGRERDFNVKDIEKEISADDKAVFVTGVNVINRVVVDRMFHWMKWIFPVVLCVIFIILFLNFRSLRYSVLAASPLFLGIGMMLALMKLAGIKFNVMNFGIVPMIIGIGVDNGIHIIRGFLEDPAATPGEATRDSLSITGRAVIMTSLTTIAGFGSLVFGEYRGIISMGMLASIGVGLCLVATIVFLPLALLKWGKKGGKF